MSGMEGGCLGIKHTQFIHFIWVVKQKIDQLSLAIFISLLAECCSP